MSILIAPDKFKFSLTAQEVCQWIGRGIHAVDQDQDLIFHPLADGGDGTLDVLAAQLSLERVVCTVKDPLFRDMSAYYYFSERENRAYIELAIASGVALLAPKEQNPLLTTTFGTGQLIKQAVDQGAQQIFLFVGGSATNDAGIGIAAALGYRFYDRDGILLTPCGKSLSLIERIDRSDVDAKIDSVDFQVLTDVNNVLYGPQGAAAVYAEQKGASPAEIKELEVGLQHFAALVWRIFGRKIDQIPGGGAAGGVGAGMVGILGAQIQSGIDKIFEWTRFPEIIKNVDWVISGEGRIDDQTLSGKVVSQVAQLAQAAGKPLVLFVGKDELSDEGRKQLAAQKIISVFDHAKDLDDAMQNAGPILKQLAQDFFSQL
ncbi:MAG TPA: glycerate kinase [Saprospiraceae bacterium]|nr:glycerate kinase [Saprospiraceae bacterium]